MNSTLCLSIRFIQPVPQFHGSRDAGEPEWPPSPMRLFQSLLNAACLRARGRPLAPEVRNAFHILEVIHPYVVAPSATVSAIGHRAYVPHNQFDIVAMARHRGGDESQQAFRKLVGECRTDKDHRPMRIEVVGDDLPTLHYLYPLADTNADPQVLLESLRPSVRSIYSLGWGVDQVVADITLIDDAITSTLNGKHYAPSARGGRPLRAPRKGSLDALQARHERFLHRLKESNWTPVPPLTAMDVVRYRSADEPISRPHAFFKIVCDDEDRHFSYPQSKLIHVAGMVKHLSIELMSKHPPRELRGWTNESWLASYVSGHQSKTDKEANLPHSQFSYIPLQSVGTEHTGPAVRRVLIVAPIGDDAWLEHLAARLDGAILKPLPNTKLPIGTRLERIEDKKKDGVRDAYTDPSRAWASVTPLILNRHVEKLKQRQADGSKIDALDREEITRQIVIALQQAGIEQPCEFEWSAFSHFRKMLSAHKYRKDPTNASKKFEIGYIRPDHLLGRTAVHVVLRFGRREDPGDANSHWIPTDLPIPGPITIGAGRHCGFGLMARVDP
jgi:CRISPR-associated protein Csb2